MTAGMINRGTNRGKNCTAGEGEIDGEAIAGKGKIEREEIIGKGEEG